METINIVLSALIILALIALIFSRPLYMGIVALGARNQSHTGIRIMRRQMYIDTETREPFEKWSTVGGLKHDLIAAFFRF